jgi:hypothetical protein
MLLHRTAMAVVIAIIVLSGLLTGCSTSPAVTTNPTVTTGPTTTPQTETQYQQVATAFLNLLPSEVPANLIPADGLKNGKEFDVNSIFTVLTHISMQEGYVLDYVYLSDGNQGGPILYIRPIDATPFKTYQEYKQAYHDVPRQTGDSTMIWLVKGATTSTFGNKMKTDGSAEGYYEYALFQTLANRFYLSGGARINDKVVVAESAKLESILTMIDNEETWTKINKEFKTTARKLDLNPVIMITDPSVLVETILFTKWGGFQRLSIVINKDYPNLVTSINLSPVLEYQCGVNPISMPLESKSN